MNTIKKWIKTYYIQIIIGLLMLLLFKECRSCSTDRQYEYYKQEFISEIDSLQIIIENEEHVIRSYRYHKIFDMITIKT